MPSPRKYQATLSLFVVCVATAIAAPAQTFTTLANLTGNSGGYPGGSLVQGIDGNLYGAGFYGGIFNKSTGLTQGTVFKSTLTGTLSLVHEFRNTVDGSNPDGLVLALNGNLYGISGPGANSCGGCGIVFGFTSAGTLFVLHKFSGPDGLYPGGMTLGPDRNFYGVTQQGGTFGFGTVFKLTPAGTLTTLYSFPNTTYADALVLGTNGNLYGTTIAGGSSGDGTVFMITRGGTLTTLHTFSGTDGIAPYGDLVQAADGNFYGTTRGGGKNNGGTVFFISPGGHTFQTLYNFTPNANGGMPAQGLVLGSDGNFYGTIVGDDQAGGFGSLFEITPSGVLTTLHTFDGTDGGDYPSLMQDTNGTFYGTTNEFGSGTGCQPALGCGTVFSLSTGLGPFITTVPPMRGIGAKVLILGQGLTGATTVTFNGVSAAFTVNSDTEITATVPAGATKGFVQVTTPSGTLSTKVIFLIG